MWSHCDAYYRINVAVFVIESFQRRAFSNYISLSIDNGDILGMCHQLIEVVNTDLIEDDGQYKNGGRQKVEYDPLCRIFERMYKKQSKTDRDKMQYPQY